MNSNTHTQVDACVQPRLEHQKSAPPQALHCSVAALLRLAELRSDIAFLHGVTRSHSDNTAASVVLLDSVTRLDITSSHASSAAAQHAGPPWFDVSCLASVRHLSMRDVVYSCMDASAVAAAMPGLTRLELNLSELEGYFSGGWCCASADHGTRGVCGLALLPQLRHLVLAGTPALGDDSALQLDTLTQLTYLKLNLGSSRPDIGSYQGDGMGLWRTLRKLQRLRCLDLYEFQPKTDHDVSGLSVFLSALTALTHLGLCVDVSEFRSSDPSLCAQLARAPALRTLRVGVADDIDRRDRVAAAGRKLGRIFAPHAAGAVWPSRRGRPRLARCALD